MIRVVENNTFTLKLLLVEVSKSNRLITSCLCLLILQGQMIRYFISTSSIFSFILKFFVESGKYQKTTSEIIIILVTSNFLFNPG